MNFKVIVVVFAFLRFLVLLSLSSASSPSYHLNLQHFPHEGSWSLVYRDHVQLRTGPPFFFLKVPMIHLQFYVFTGLHNCLSLLVMTPWWYQGVIPSWSPFPLSADGNVLKWGMSPSGELKKEVLLLALKRLATEWWGAMWWKLCVPLLLRAALMKTRDLSIYNGKELNSANSLVNLQENPELLVTAQLLSAKPRCPTMDNLK